MSIAQLPNRIWVLDRIRYLREQLPDSVYIESLLIHGPRPGTAYAFVVDCIERVDYLQRACALVGKTSGCTLRLVQLEATTPPAPPAPPSAFANSLRPALSEPLLQARNSSQWYTALLTHLFHQTAPKQHLVLFGPPGCGKTLALDRARQLAANRSMLHFFVSGAAESDENIFMSARQFFGSAASAQREALFVLDDIEAFANTQCANKFFALIETSAGPTRCVLVCNDKYARRVVWLRKGAHAKHYRFCEATAVTDAALDAHLRRQYPTLTAARRGAVVADAHGDVRAAQLAAEMEVCVVARAQELIGVLAQTVGTEPRRRLAARLDVLTRHLAMSVDDQRHGSLIGDMLLCVRASSAPPGALVRERARAVARQCATLLEPRSVDALTVMQSNYARLCESGDDSELELLASMADDVSGAYHYKQSIVDAMLADKFGRSAPDNSMDENFKEQLMFDIGVVLPCVRASKATVGRGARRELRLEFPDYALQRSLERVGSACRALDARHEVLVRATLARYEQADAERGVWALSAKTSAELADAARHSVSVSLTTMAKYRDFTADKPPGASGGSTEEPSGGAGGDEDGDVTVPDDDDAPGAVSRALSIGQLERTLFAFPVVAGRGADEVERCAEYGFDVDAYTLAVLFHRPHASESEVRKRFLAAKSAVVLHQNHAAIAVGCTESGGGGGGAVRAATKRKPVAAKATSGGTKKTEVVAAPTFMDKFLKTVKRSKVGEV